MAPRKNTDSDALLIETATTVRLMNERLFGDGGDGSGSLGRMYSLMEKHNDAALTNLREHAEQDKIDFKAVGDAVTKVNQKVIWYGGGIAAAGAIGTFVLGALSIHFAMVAAAARAASALAH